MAVNDWKNEVTACLLELKARENLVISFDLDYTVWPANCFEDTSPPYSAKPGERHVNCYSRWNQSARVLSLYPDVLDIISLCRNCSITLTICSKSPVKTSAEGILRALDVWKDFVHPQIYYSRKTTHLRNLSETLNAKYHEFLFFDDDVRNIRCCEPLGVTCCLVDRKTGLDGPSFLRGLNMFLSKKKTSSIMMNWMSGSTNHFPSPSITGCSSKRTGDNEFDLSSKDAVRLKLPEHIRSSSKRALGQISPKEASAISCPPSSNKGKPHDRKKSCHMEQLDRTNIEIGKGAATSFQERSDRENSFSLSISVVRLDLDTK